MQFDPKILELLRVDLSGDKRQLVIRSAARKEQASEYSFGIEEEYFLADATDLEVAVETPNELFEAANWTTGGQAMRETQSWPAARIRQPSGDIPSRAQDRVTRR
jgi:carboxylate-amine ligase